MPFDRNLVQDSRTQQFGYGEFVYAQAFIPAATMTAGLVNYLTVFCAYCTQKTWVVKELDGNEAAAIEIWADMNPGRTLAEVETHDADLLVPQTLPAATVNNSEIEYTTTSSYAWMTFRASGDLANVRVWFCGL